MKRQALFNGKYDIHDRNIQKVNEFQQQTNEVILYFSMLRSYSLFTFFLHHHTLSSNVTFVSNIQKIDYPVRKY